MSKWIEFNASFQDARLRLVVPDHFDPDNEEHVQYLYDNIDDWVFPGPECDDIRSLKVIETPGPQQVRIVDGFGPDAKVLRTEMRDPRPDGEITAERFGFPDPNGYVPPVIDPNQAVLDGLG